MSEWCRLSIVTFLCMIVVDFCTIGGSGAASADDVPPHHYRRNRDRTRRSVLATREAAWGSVTRSLEGVTLRFLPCPVMYCSALTVLYAYCILCLTELYYNAYLVLQFIRNTLGVLSPETHYPFVGACVSGSIFNGCVTQILPLGRA